MIDEENVALNGGEDESATDLRSVIQGALDKQRETVQEAPAEPAETVEAKEAEKPPRDDGRDEHGRFKAKEPAEQPPEAKDAEPVVQEAPAAAPQDAPKPPIGWPVAAKADWDKLPEHIRAAVAKREQEVSDGFARYSGLKEYATIAEQNGTTLSAAVADYARVEDSLRRDFLSGLDGLAARFGFDPAQVAQAYAVKYGITNGGQIGQGYQPPALDPDSIIQQATARATAEFEERQMRRESLGEIERFASDPAHAYFENVREDMALLLQNGKAPDLKTAYEMACWANPETRAILLKSQSNPAPDPQSAVQKARAAAKAVGGAPVPGFNPGKPVDTSKMSLRETISAAVASQR